MNAVVKKIIVGTAPVLTLVGILMLALLAEQFRLQQKQENNYISKRNMLVKLVQNLDYLFQDTNDLLTTMRALSSKSSSPEFLKQLKEFEDIAEQLKQLESNAHPFFENLQTLQGLVYKYDALIDACFPDINKDE